MCFASASTYGRWCGVACAPAWSVAPCPGVVRSVPPPEGCQLHLIVDVDRYLVALHNQRVDGAGIVLGRGGRRDDAVARVGHHVCLDLLHQRRHPARGEQPRRARRAAAARLGEHVDVAIVVVLFLDDLLLPRRDRAGEWARASQRGRRARPAGSGEASAATRAAATRGKQSWARARLLALVLLLV